VRVLRHDLTCLVGDRGSDPWGMHTVKDARGSPVTIANCHCSSSVLVDVMCSILKLTTAELL
jgi:hypothetical protein